MDPIPPPKFQRGGRFTRKRRRDNSTGEGNDSEGVTLKNTLRGFRGTVEPCVLWDPRVSKRTGSNPVHGLSVGWAFSLGATVS
ncbi:hypothetical protein E2C01_054807 [Portunus trituberculatus]|uniref:Uncharacterized protein n=1 Tax=Portunus trituberculatus TaxID=210409 RepID=A0A5B7GKT4_PORTR|nr:hypothetical protein [Portunus trituberculatus]